MASITYKQRFNNDTRDAILSYLEAGGKDAAASVELNEPQQKQLDRWRFADEKIREGRGGYRREKIATAIIEKFGVSRDTAYRDIVNAEYVFSSSAPLNKKYIIQRRIEFLEEWITKMYVMQDYETAAKLEKELRSYIQIYPDFQPMRSPKTIVFNVQQNLMVTNISPEEAFTDAEEIINQLNKDDGI